MRSWYRCVLVAILLMQVMRVYPQTLPDANSQVIAPEDRGMDTGKVARAVAYLRGEAPGEGVRELVIVRRGAIVWHGDNTDMVHGIWSATKSFTSTCLGLLLDDGKCSLDTRASEVLPALRGSYPAVTLRHFAMMTSGYRAVGDEPMNGYIHGPSRTPFDPSPEPLFAPGTRYCYWDSAMNQFGNVLTHIAGEPLNELFPRRIADPIGMNPEAWSWGDFGVIDGLKVNGGSGNHGRHVQVSARELARFGWLFLNEGRWCDKQLISADWVRTATSPHVPRDLPVLHAEVADGRGVYGLNWWVNGIGPDEQRKWPGTPPSTFAASGYNNNLFVIPEWEMVVARLGLDQDRGKISDEVYGEFLRRLGDAILE